MPLRLSSTLLTLALGFAPACSSTPHGFAWGIDFADPGLRARATLVEAEVRTGGCNGEALFSTRINALEGGAQPTRLGRGRYGFYAHARDASCTWYAAGCSEASLPSDAHLTVVLQELTYGARDPSCVPGDQNEGAVSVEEAGMSEQADAGQSPEDPSEADGGPDGLTPDGGVSTPDPDPDSGQDAGLPGASKDCAGLTPDVVACYDFNASLTDASRFHNDAQGDQSAFEILGDDRAIRVQGRVISVADADSLDLQQLTLELWVRIDALINAWHQPNEMSILLDKDKQYLAGFTVTGAPTFSIYDETERQTSITGSDGMLQEGELAYLAFTYDGAIMAMYVDGQRVDDKAVSAVLGRGTGTMHLGTGSPDGTKPFNGLIDAIRISDRAHSDAEICARAGKELTAGTCN